MDRIGQKRPNGVEVTGLVQHLKSDDRDEFVEILRPSSGTLFVEPIQPRFHCDIRTAVLPRLAMTEIQVDQARVTSDERFYWSLTFPQGRPIQLFARGRARDFSLGGAHFILPDGKAELRTGDDSHCLVVNIPLETFQSAARAYYGEHGPEVPLSDVIRLDSQAGLSLWREASFLWSELNRGSSILQSELTTRQAEDNLLGLILSAVENEPHHRRRVLPRARSQGLSRALYLIHANLEGPLSAIVVAEAAGVSARTLNRAFQDRFGLTMAAYVTRQRLHQARRELLEADPKQDKIIDVALRLGFSNPGRFAGAYRELFQEFPSDTLRR
jgi:AraC-like DNA-binding protein